MTPMPGSVVRTRSSFCAASSVPSATTTMPACCEKPTPSPHPPGLRVRGGHGPGVEVVAADDDGRLQLAVGHEAVELEPRPCTLPVAQPADPCRQPPEGPAP